MAKNCAGMEATRPVSISCKSGAEGAGGNAIRSVSIDGISDAKGASVDPIGSVSTSEISDTGGDSTDAIKSKAEAAGANATQSVPMSGISDASNEWLVSITKEGKGRGDQKQKTTNKPCIQKVAGKMRDKEKNKVFLFPQVVSLGPYHHGTNPEFELMEKQKKIAALRFASNNFENLQKLYKAVAKVTEEAKESYDAGLMTKLKDEDFTRMMFLDGCFILHFIEGTNKANIDLDVSNRLIPLIIRDMFLLENQLPFVVLDALMSLKLEKKEIDISHICRFIDTQIFPLCPHNSMRLLPYRWFGWRSQGYSGLCFGIGNGGDDAPIHLLDMLRTILLGIPSTDYRVETTNYTLHHFGSVMELKQVGIRFGKNHSSQLTDIKFNEYFFFPQLLLPPMVINDTTISQMLNLIALEMCPDNHSDYGITAYLSFLDSLINHADDVKELRSKGILHHALGSDEEVAKLFNEWPIEASYDLNLYRNVKSSIGKYRRNRVRISIGEWLYTYFRRPWTTISLVAAILLLFFTGLQTFFTAFPRN